MTEPNPDLDARLARLAARKAATGKAATGGEAGAPTPTPNPASTAGPTAPPGTRRRRRKHPAAAGRILSVGLSSSAFLSMVAAFAQTGASGTSTAAIVTTPVTARVRTKIVDTRVRFRYISRSELESYIASREWRGKAGGYAIQGLAGCFVQRLIGSYTNVVGLPLTEVVSLLNSEKFPIQYNWLKYAQVDRD